MSAAGGGAVRDGSSGGPPDRPRVLPARTGQGECEDRGSRFLAWVFRADDEAAFQGRLTALRAEHPKARHHCWAWRIGGAYRFHDDGEPGGTAGRPMLQVLDGSGLDDVAAVCVRYFGGVKLGTGGLARAYSGATARALEAAGRRTEVLRVGLGLHLDFPRLGLRDEIGSLFAGAAFAGDFDESGWTGRLTVDAQQLDAVRAFLAERGVEAQTEDAHDPPGGDD